MIYDTVAKFSYNVDGVEDAIDERIFFDNVQPEYTEIITQYYSLINEGKIDEAVSLINNSKMNVFNASLFNALKNRIAKIQTYYINKYWHSESNMWSRDANSTSFVYYPATNQLPSSTDRPITYTVVTNYDDLYIATPITTSFLLAYGDFPQTGFLLGDFSKNMCEALSVAYEDHTNYAYSLTPITIERGKYEVRSFIYDEKLREKFSGLNIRYIIFPDLWNNEDAAISLEGLSKEGYGINCTVAEALEDEHFNYNEKAHELNLTNVHDINYEKETLVDNKFNVFFSFELPSSITVDELRQLLKNEYIQLMITPIE